SQRSRSPGESRAMRLPSGETPIAHEVVVGAIRRISSPVCASHSCTGPYQSCEYRREPSVEKTTWYTPGDRGGAGWPGCGAGGHLASGGEGCCGWRFCSSSAVV